MRYYLRSDGNYDAYDVEPRIVTAEEFEHIQYVSNQIKRREELLAELHEIDARIAKEQAVSKPAEVTETFMTLNNPEPQEVIVGEVAEEPSFLGQEEAEKALVESQKVKIPVSKSLQDVRKKI